MHIPGDILIMGVRADAEHLAIAIRLTPDELAYLLNHISSSSSSSSSTPLETILLINTTNTSTGSTSGNIEMYRVDA